MVLIFRNSPIRNLVSAYKNITGKNNSGKLTFYHRGGGYKRKFRVIDFKKKFRNVFGLLKRYEYDPFRKNTLILICYLNGVLCYTLAVKDLVIGTFIRDFGKNLVLGSTYFLKRLPIGTFLCMLELSYNKKLRFIRAPGTKGQILSKTKNLVSILLPSNKVRIFSHNCKAVYGILALNYKKKYKKLKAGINRNLNLKPIVRGVAMNPIDHPHGGGQGKTSGGRKMSVSPWSKYTKGLKPKKKKQKLNYQII